jgi:hypothetical protein
MIKTLRQHDSVTDFSSVNAPPKAASASVHTMLPTINCYLKDKS